jgi:hypothetical protein
MPADEEAGSKGGSQASGRSWSKVSPEIVSEDAANQGEADPEEGLDLVIEEPDLDPHEDPDEELLQQRHGGSDYDEAPAEEPEEDEASEAHHRRRASFRGEQAAACISRPGLASVLHLPPSGVGIPAALLRCCPRLPVWDLTKLLRSRRQALAENGASAARRREPRTRSPKHNVRIPPQCKVLSERIKANHLSERIKANHFCRRRHQTNTPYFRQT